jgi:hypothetical protein
MTGGIGFDAVRTYIMGLDAFDGYPKEVGESATALDNEFGDMKSLTGRGSRRMATLCATMARAMAKVAGDERVVFADDSERQDLERLARQDPGILLECEGKLEAADLKKDGYYYREGRVDVDAGDRVTLTLDSSGTAPNLLAGVVSDETNAFC